NQPMGFYHPATLVKDAQRHGLRVLPVDVMKSDWKCTLEEEPKPVVGRWSLVNDKEEARVGAGALACPAGRSPAAFTVENRFISGPGLQNPPFDQNRTRTNAAYLPTTNDEPPTTEPREVHWNEIGAYTRSHKTQISNHAASPLEANSLENHLENK